MKSTGPDQLREIVDDDGVATAQYELNIATFHQIVSVTSWIAFSFLL